MALIEECKSCGRVPDPDNEAWAVLPDKNPLKVGIFRDPTELVVVCRICLSEFNVDSVKGGIVCNCCKKRWPLYPMDQEHGSDLKYPLDNHTR